MTPYDLSDNPYDIVSNRTDYLRYPANWTWLCFGYEPKLYTFVLSHKVQRVNSHEGTNLTVCIHKQIENVLKGGQNVSNNYDSLYLVIKLQAKSGIQFN